uniref:transcription factor IBH1-like 1 n=1 Tax=Erigeron canadensis TaxID=72917 RepID=UPI001CB9010F|nr:transcription factor IBH1-like 1 [Erigeron canadensis]
MHDYSSQLKKEFIKKWIKGLQTCCSSSKKQMNVMERKKKIKLSADIALASAKNGTTSWSRALLSDIQKDEQNKPLVNNVLGPESKFVVGTNSQIHSMVTKNYCHKRLIIRSKKVLKMRRSGASKRMKKMEPGRRPNSATCVAKRLVKKRTEVLKGLVPGGNSMDEISIIKEALDYILCLRVQVDVMKDLVNNNATSNVV